jgi:hypothetical protein
MSSGLFPPPGDWHQICPSGAEREDKRAKTTGAVVGRAANGNIGEVGAAAAALNGKPNQAAAAAPASKSQASTAAASHRQAAQAGASTGNDVQVKWTEPASVKKGDNRESTE